MDTHGVEIGKEASHLHCKLAFCGLADQQTVARTDTNQCCRHVAHDMAKGIQISRVTSANTTHSTMISAVNHKQLTPQHIREGKSPDDKKTLHFVLIFLQISTFLFFSGAHTGTLQNHSISPRANTVLNNTVESSTIFHSNLMLRINWFYEI
jgi:hypothetical protein